jgi:hypothetical protein
MTSVSPTVLTAALGFPRNPSILVSHLVMLAPPPWHGRQVSVVSGLHGRTKPLNTEYPTVHGTQILECSRQRYHESKNAYGVPCHEATGCAQGNGNGVYWVLPAAQEPVCSVVQLHEGVNLFGQ